MPKQLIRCPTAQSVLDYYQPPLCGVPQPPRPNPDKEIFVLATAVFQAIEPRSFDSHRCLVAQMAVDYGNNLWLIPVHERMPFPDACIFAVGAMMNMEVASGRKADWFFWLEDDICISQLAARMLREAADPQERPFVAAVGYDRGAPFLPAVWNAIPGSDNLAQWETSPTEGVYEVGATGLVAALFHRSLFDKIKEPWFAAGTPVINPESPTHQVARGAKPDSWWCLRLRKAGIPIYVHAGISATHLGAKMPVNHLSAPVLRNLRGYEPENFERTMRGQLAQGMDTRNGSPVPPSVRQGGSQGLDGGHAGGGRPRPASATGESGGVGLPQAAPAPRAELPSAVRIEESPELWRNWNPAWQGRPA